jgi:hypothetical protein
MIKFTARYLKATAMETVTITASSAMSFFVWLFIYSISDRETETLCDSILNNNLIIFSEWQSLLLSGYINSGLKFLLDSGSIDKKKF